MLQIEQQETALADLKSGVITEYNLDTGQSVVKIKRADTTSLQLNTNELYNLLATLEARACGGNVVQVIPAR